MPKRVFLILLLSSTLVACPDDPPATPADDLPVDPGAVADAGGDVPAADPGEADLPSDPGDPDLPVSDVPPDPGADLPPDGGIQDAGVDAAEDVPADLPEDAISEVAPDGQGEVQADVPTDGVADPGGDAALDVPPSDPGVDTEPPDTGADAADPGPADVPPDIPIDVPPPPSGDTCAEFFPIPPDGIPFVGSGDTAALADDFDSTGCGPTAYGAGQGDMVFEFTPAVSGAYPLSLPVIGANFVYVATDCADIANSCVGQSDDQSIEEPPPLVLELDAGTTYYIFVDGLAASDEGSFVLSVGEPCVADCDGKSCGPDGCGGVCGDGCTSLSEPACASDGTCVAAGSVDGNTCGNAITSGQAVYVANGDTTFGSDELSVPADACGAGSLAAGSGGNDHVYTFTPAVTATYSVSLSAQFDATIYALTDCSQPATSCVALMPTDQGSLALALTGGQTYTLVVDAVDGATDSEGAYELQIGEPCFPQCGGKECGPDSCGGLCGECTGVDEQCNVDFVCEVLTNPPGDTCSVPIVVSQVVEPPELPVELPATLPNDTSTGAADDFDVPEGACGSAAGAGVGSPDLVYEFIPAVSGMYVVELTGAFSGAVLYITSGCPEGDFDCIAGTAVPDSESLVFVAQAATPYYVTVDGVGEGAAGAYTIVFDLVCPADCQNKECGPDGCGGSCGECGAGLACNLTDQVCEFCVPTCDPPECGDDGCGGSCGDCPAGQVCGAGGTCEAAAAGDSCDDTVASPLDDQPWSDNGDTSDYAHDYFYPSGACAGAPYGAGMNAPDVVYAFSSATGGDYTARLTPTFDGVLFAFDDCSAGVASCLDQSNVVGSGEVETIDLSLAAGATVFIGVDGSTAGEQGPYLFEIGPSCVPSCGGKACGPDGCGGSCGTCSVEGTICDEAAWTCVDMTGVQGDTCAEPFLLSLDVPVGGDTSDDADVYSYLAGECGGASAGGGSGGAEEVWVFQPLVETPHTVSVDASFDAVVYVLKNGCTDVASMCLAAADASVGSESLNVGMRPGDDFYIVVDSATGATGTFTLEVNVPGDICSMAWPIGASGLPASDSGDTSKALNNYTIGAADCGGGGAAGGASNDQVWSFQPSASGQHTIEVVPDGAFDAALYVLTDCADVASSCLAASQNAGTESVSVALTAGTTYYIVVDGASDATNDQGFYTLTITGP